METGKIHYTRTPELEEPKLLLGFFGWMDGGEVSSGTLRCLIEKTHAEKFAELSSDGYYIQNLPGSMEFASLFRPHTVIQDGLIQRYELTTNEFFCNERDNVILFLGKEPNMNWKAFAEQVLQLCTRFEVSMIYFIGSVSGLVPHTRQPRLLCNVSDSLLKETIKHYGVKFSNYDGPASFTTYLTVLARNYKLRMANLVATVPAYVHGNNPLAIEAVVTRLAGILDISPDLKGLRKLSENFEKKLNELVQQQPELEESIDKLEEDYDNEIFDTEMGEFKHWLEQKGIRLD